MTMATTVPADYRTTPAARGTQASYTGRTLLTLSALAIGLVLIGDRVPTFAWGTLVLVALYLFLTNAGATADLIDYLTNPTS